MVKIAYLTTLIIGYIALVQCAPTGLAPVKENENTDGSQFIEGTNTPPLERAGTANIIDLDDPLCLFVPLPPFC